MVKSIHKISKAFLLVMCLSALPATMMAEVEEAQNSQIEMGQNQVSISVSGSTIRVKNAEGYEWNAPSVEKKGGLKLGIAEGKYKFPPDFDERFDAMDAEVAELFG